MRIRHQRTRSYSCTLLYIVSFIVIVYCTKPHFREKTLFACLYRSATSLPCSVSLETGADSSEGPARSVAKHEAALFAYLAGNSELLLASDLTQSWEDQVRTVSFFLFLLFFHLFLLRSG